MKKLFTSLVLVYLAYQPAQAADENFDVYVFSNIKYDDNVFRVANQQEAIAQTGGSQEDDIEVTAGVGANVKIPISRQQFSVDAELRRSQFDRFDQLDNNNGEIKGVWDWVYASRASGVVSYEYEESLTDFFELQDSARDTEADQNFSASANIPVHPRWTVGVGGNLRDVSFDERSFLDRSEEGFYGELVFKTRAKVFVGVRYQETDTEFDSNTSSNSDFQESEVSALARYQSTGKSSFALRIGRTDRDSEISGSGQDFNGTTGQLTYTYLFGGKSSLDLELFRDTSQLNEVVGLVVTEGISFIPKWQISPKTTFRGRVAYEERDFENVNLPGTGNIRSDELFTLAARVSYKLNRALSLNLDARFRDRGSNLELSEFDQAEISAGVNFRL